MKKNNYKYLLSYATGIALFLAQSFDAIAGSHTASTQVTAIPNSSCTMAVPTSIDFGSLASSPTFPINAQYNIDVTCDNTVAYTITHNKGANYTGSTDGAAEMVNGASTLTYYFYRDAVGSETLWTADTESISGTGTGSAISHPAVMKISSSADLAGVTSFGTEHTDTVIFTIAF